MTSQELFKSINGKGRIVAHTRAEQIAALEDSMRKFPQWWGKSILLCGMTKSDGKICLADPWGGVGVYEPSFIMELWNKVKAA